MAKKTGKCRWCNSKIEYVECKGPFWRHVGLIPDPPHGAAPRCRRWPCPGSRAGGRGDRHEGRGKKGAGMSQDNTPRCPYCGARNPHGTACQAKPQGNKRR